MSRKTPPKSFADWTPPEKPAREYADRAEFAGMGPDEAAEHLVDLNADVVRMRESTRNQKVVAVKKVFMDLKSRGLDLASVGPDDIAEYREWLSAMVDEGVWQENYLAHIARAWNSAMAAVFGDRSLHMEGFRETPSKKKRLTASEMDRLIEAVPKVRFLSEHYRRAFDTWLKVNWCASARVGSLITDEMRVEHINWEDGVLSLEHMKNMDTAHEVVLNSRALVALRGWVAHLRDIPAWRGSETVLFCGPDGSPLSHKWCNQSLKKAAVTAGINKPVSTHVVRKSAGTFMARHNSRYAREQLGISEKVFEKHYNVPLIEDRLSRRDLLPGSDWTPKTAEEIAGVASLALREGKITPDEHEARLSEAEKLRSLPTWGREEDPAYG